MKKINRFNLEERLNSLDSLSNEQARQLRGGFNKYTPIPITTGTPTPPISGAPITAPPPTNKITFQPITAPPTYPITVTPGSVGIVGRF